MLSPRDHGKLGSTVVDKANALLEKRGKTSALSLASAPGPLEAGAILRKDRVASILFEDGA